MKSRRVPHIEKYLDPLSDAWSGEKGERVSLIPTPVGLQPTEYVRNAWTDRPYGQAPEVSVRSVHDGESLAIKLAWAAGAHRPGGEFPDAAAVAFPIKGKPLLALMGAEDAPIHILRWTDGEKEVRSVVATGIGSSRPGPAIKCASRAARSGETMQLVIVRALGSGGGVAALLPGRKSAIGFAVWRGANQERAGIKAFSNDWTSLVLDA